MAPHARCPRRSIARARNRLKRVHGFSASSAARAARSVSAISRKRCPLHPTSWRGRDVRNRHRYSGWRRPAWRVPEFRRRTMCLGTAYRARDGAGRQRPSTLPDSQKLQMVSPGRQSGVPALPCGGDRCTDGLRARDLGCDRDGRGGGGGRPSFLTKRSKRLLCGCRGFIRQRT
jgi:hypothetical protein